MNCSLKTEEYFFVQVVTLVTANEKMSDEKSENLHEQ